MVTDLDGNIYHTVNIGSQTWMVENLKVTRYRNGDPIANVLQASEWTELKNGAYCDFDNDTTRSEVYGRLYNWYAVQDKRNIAPAGWHVPTHAEWSILEQYLDSSVDTTLSGSQGTDIGCKLKEAGGAHWTSSKKESDNSSGFNALPGAMRRGMTGEFGQLAEYGHWWASTKHPDMGAWCRDLYYKSCDIGRGNALLESGFSVRCIKDK